MNIGIIIGISEYDAKENRLPACKNDSDAIKHTLDISSKYNDILYCLNIKSSIELKNKLVSFIQKFKDSDIDEVFFYYTGHGIFKSNEFLYPLADFSSSRKKQTSLENAEVDNLLRSLNPKLVIKVVDACYSGISYIKDISNIDKYLKESTGNFQRCYFMFSSLTDQGSYQDNKLSYFTRSFLEAIIKKEDAEVRYKDIIDYISDDLELHQHQSPFFVTQADFTEVFSTFNQENKEELSTKHIKSINLNSLNQPIDLDSHSAHDLSTKLPAFGKQTPPTAFKALLNNESIVYFSIIGSTLSKPKPKDTDLLIIVQDTKAKQQILDKLKEIKTIFSGDTIITSCDLPSHWIYYQKNIFHIMLFSFLDLDAIDPFFRSNLHNQVTSSIKTKEYIKFNTKYFSTLLLPLSKFRKNFALSRSVVEQGFGIRLLEKIIREKKIEYTDSLDSTSDYIKILENDEISDIGIQIISYVLKNILARVITIYKYFTIVAAKKDDIVIAEIFQIFNNNTNSKLEALLKSFSTILDEMGIPFSDIQKDELTMFGPYSKNVLRFILTKQEGIKKISEIEESYIEKVKWNYLIVGISTLCSKVREVLGILDFWQSYQKKTDSLIIADYPYDRHAAVVSSLHPYIISYPNIFFLCFLETNKSGNSYISGITSYFIRYVLVIAKQNAENDFSAFIYSLRSLFSRIAIDLTNKLNVIHESFLAASSTSNWDQTDIENASADFINTIKKVFDIVSEEYDPNAEYYRHNSFILGLSYMISSWREPLSNRDKENVSHYFMSNSCYPVLCWLEALSLESSIISNPKCFSVWLNKSKDLHEYFQVNNWQEFSDKLKTSVISSLTNWIFEAINYDKSKLNEALIERFNVFAFRQGYIYGIPLNSTSNAEIQLEQVSSKIEKKIIQHSSQSTFVRLISENHKTVESSNPKFIIAENIINIIVRTVPIKSAIFITIKNQYENIDVNNVLTCIVSDSDFLAAPKFSILDLSVAFSDLDKDLIEKSKVLVNSLKKIITQYSHDQTSYLGNVAPDINTWNLNTTGFKDYSSIITSDSNKSKTLLRIPVIVTPPLDSLSNGVLLSMPITGVFLFEIESSLSSDDELVETYTQFAQLVGTAWQHETLKYNHKYYIEC